MYTDPNLVNEYWTNVMKDLSGNDGEICFSIKRKSFSKPQRKEIKRTLKEVEEVTGIEFTRTKKKHDDIRFIGKPEITPTTYFENDEVIQFQDAIVGRVSIRSKRMKVFIRDGWADNSKNFPSREFTDVQQYALKHEIGHALGLDHPAGVGSNPDYNSYDTVMSYNWMGNTEWSVLDKLTLSEIW